VASLEVLRHCRGGEKKSLSQKGDGCHAHGGHARFLGFFRKERSEKFFRSPRGKKACSVGREKR